MAPGFEMSNAGRILGQNDKMGKGARHKFHEKGHEFVKSGRQRHRV